MIKETFNWIWREYVDVINWCIKLYVLNWEKTSILSYKLIDISFWAIVNLCVLLKSSKHTSSSSCSSDMPDHDQPKVAVSEISFPWILSLFKTIKKLINFFRVIDDQKSYNLVELFWSITWILCKKVKRKHLRFLKN